MIPGLSPSQRIMLRNLRSVWLFGDRMHETLPIRGLICHSICNRVYITCRCHFGQSCLGKSPSATAWFCHATAVTRSHRSPSTFISIGRVWRWIGQKYLLRYLSRRVCQPHVWEFYLGHLHVPPQTGLGGCMWKAHFFIIEMVHHTVVRQTMLSAALHRGTSYDGDITVSFWHLFSQSRAWSWRPCLIPFVSPRSSCSRNVLCIFRFKIGFLGHYTVI